MTYSTNSASIGYPWSVYVSSSNAMYDSYMKGDDLILGEIPRNELLIMGRDLVIWKPYMPLLLTPIILDTIKKEN